MHTYRILYNCMKDKGKLGIGQAAEFLDVSIDTLRRWDKKGKLKAQKTEGGHRYYSQFDLKLFKEDVVVIGDDWILSSPKEPDKKFYCQTIADFKGRLSKLEHDVAKLERIKNIFPLITAITGEIGNNSFDHNLGNWLDIPGLFFAYDLSKGVIVLADRGQGVLRTLRKVRPELKNDKEALKVAFTEIISSRAPEARGNGLKFVRAIIKDNPFELNFYSGAAELYIKEGDSVLNVRDIDVYFNGCLVVFKF
ncbi:MAG TPA: MerR family DNA-binding transcriptional regulator [Patescibacteria group bacterium]|nr:MerR family DNA-binding transcriptional regulator [Patescibacteria group bacterium]